MEHNRLLIMLLYFESTLVLIILFLNSNANLHFFVRDKTKNHNKRY